MDDVNLKAHDYYLDRELSFLEFNQRVLDLAADPSIPLLERVKFLSISCSNLDEFFEIRVAGLKERQELGSTHGGHDGRSIAEQLESIHLRTRALVAEQYRLLNDVLTPALVETGIHLVRQHRLADAQVSAVEGYFEREVEPVLSPLGLDPARPFPRIQNKSLNFIVRLSGTDAFGRDTNLAIVQVPRSLPRVIRLPPTDGDDGLLHLAYLSTLIQRFVSRLFDGMTVEGCWQFRLTRNSDLFVDEEEIDDLRRAVEGELASRRYGDEVRLETAHDCPADITGFLLQQFKLGLTDLYQVPGPVNLNRLMSVYDLVDRPDLKFPPFTPGVPERLIGRTDLFAAIRDKDVLLHHPFQSFAPVVDFVRLAARDPQVLAIKQTLYRSGSESAIVDALVEAARNGKDVTVIIELMARFDEAANIALANKLQEAGAHVMYGVVGYKTHAKLIMVVRREDGGLRRYCHLGTGNYHARTARYYTDYGLLTADEKIGQDLHEVFLQLTSLTRVPRLRKLLQSPFTLHETLLAKIRREADHARAGRPARIIARMNSLIEPRVIEALYQASNAGVEIDLIVRGVCALRPGIARVSERIRVRSVLGRFLEHARVYYFQNDGDDELWCSSADWMDRNFFRRVEVAFPIEGRRHRERILGDLECYLADDVGAWILQADGRYERTRPAAGEKPFSAQQALLQRYADA
ncbi:MAG: polyphosphate kinase 1 [Steroidobacteraceae bacterium]|jgi:polyphosphate kinase|nr:polyphosphate kinase 1 [Steroidobacteraceae bacterium]